MRMKSPIIKAIGIKTAAAYAIKRRIFCRRSCRIIFWYITAEGIGWAIHASSSPIWIVFSSWSIRSASHACPSGVLNQRTTSQDSSEVASLFSVFSMIDRSGIFIFIFFYQLTRKAINRMSSTNIKEIKIVSRNVPAVFLSLAHNVFLPWGPRYSSYRRFLD